MAHFTDAFVGQVGILNYWRSATGRHLALRTPIGERAVSQYGDVAGDLAALTETSETYFLSADLIDLLFDVSDGLPEETTLWRTDLPIPRGFLWLGKDLRLPQNAVSSRGNQCAIRAIQWYDSLKGKCLAYLAYEAEDNYHIFPGVVGYSTWPYETRLANYREEKDEGDATWLHRFIYSFFSFVRDELVSVDKESAPRGLRRHVPTQPTQKLISVVKLRRVVSHHYTERDAEHRDWSCQWFVRGHWRNQFYPAMKAHRMKYVRPHIKGPEGKPLKPPTAHIYAVVR